MVMTAWRRAAPMAVGPRSGFCTITARAALATRRSLPAKVFPFSENLLEQDSPPYPPVVAAMLPR